MARNFLKERSSFLNMRGSYRPTLLAIYYLLFIIMKIGSSTILLNSTLCSGAFIDMFIKTKKYLRK